MYWYLARGSLLTHPFYTSLESALCVSWHATTRDGYTALGASRRGTVEINIPFPVVITRGATTLELWREREREKSRRQFVVIDLSRNKITIASKGRWRQVKSNEESGLKMRKIAVLAIMKKGCERSFRRELMDIFPSIKSTSQHFSHQSEFPNLS